MADRGDAAVEALLTRLDDMLGRLEQIPGATAALALDAVQALTELYGTALGRMVDIVAADDAALERVQRDRLLSHLMALHGIHPSPVAERVEQALDTVRPYVHSHGGEVRLVGIDQGVATVEMTGSCDGCASSAATLQHAVSDAVLGLAPELESVQALPATAPTHPAPTTVIGVDALFRRPSAVG